MIEMQYNFPLLPGIGEQWKQRLAAAVAELRPDNADELRPTFRMKRTELKNVAAQWLGARPERTWIVGGGHHGTLVSLIAAGMAGKAIAVESVTYTGVIEQSRMIGAKLAACAFDGEGMMPEALREACQRERVSAIYAMPSVHNPMGYVTGLERRKAIVDVAREFDLMIVEDDAYGFMESEAPASYAELAPERTFYVRGLSKVYAPATQTGLLVAPERFGAAIENAIKNSTTGSSLVHNAAAMSLVADGSVDAVMELKRMEGARRNAAARAVFGARAALGARCAWHLWIRLPEGMTGAEAQRRCEERGVLVSGAAGFTVPGIPVPEALRIGLGGELDAERTQRGVEIVGEVLERWRS